MLKGHETIGPYAHCTCTCEEPLRGICSECGEECEEEFIDLSFDYEYGSIHGMYKDGMMASPCCNAEVVEGGVKLIRENTHVARRDHSDGKIMKGDKYTVKVYRHWKKDGPQWVTTKKIKHKEK